MIMISVEEIAAFYCCVGNKARSKQKSLLRLCTTGVDEEEEEEEFTISVTRSGLRKRASQQLQERAIRATLNKPFRETAQQRRTRCSDVCWR